MDIGKVQIQSNNLTDGQNQIQPSVKNYLRIFETTPAPIVLPPSLIEKRIPSLIGIGEINSTVNSTLSPGIIILFSVERIILPVTSAVLKKKLRSIIFKERFMSTSFFFT